MVLPNGNTAQAEKEFATVEDWMVALDRVMEGEVDVATSPDGDITIRRICNGLVRIKVGDKTFVVKKNGAHKDVRN